MDILKESMVSQNEYEEPEKLEKMYTLKISKEFLIIINKKKREDFLIIERENGKTNFLKKEKLKNYEMNISKDFWGVFGMAKFFDLKFLIMISHIKRKIKFQKDLILKIGSIKFILINKNNKLNSNLLVKAQEYLKKLKNISKMGFYFSYNYPLQNKYSPKKNFNKKNKFIWNYKGLLKLTKNAKRLNFFTFVIQGYIKSINHKLFTFLLISRRSSLMGGTRYNSRGTNVEGYTANFVESEQILFLKDKVFSFIQIRGSVPFFWNQKGLVPNIVIDQNDRINKGIMKSHLLKIFKDYEVDKIFLFNLLGARGQEETLTNKFEELYKDLENYDFLKVERNLNAVSEVEDYIVNSEFEIINKEFSEGDVIDKKEFEKTSIDDFLENLYKKLIKEYLTSETNKTQIEYLQVDFHAITKETDFSAMDQHLTKLYKENNTYTIYQNQEKLKDQKSIIRSNCLDCLDRTNAIQTKISFLIFLSQLQSENLISKIFKNHKSIKPLKLLETENSLIKNFREIWANNADAISIIYAGTGSTTSSATRKGSKSGLTSFLDHGFKSISRLYLNIFDDGFKQNIIDSFLYKKEFPFCFKKRRFLDNMSFEVFNVVFKNEDFFNEDFIDEICNVKSDIIFVSIFWQNFRVEDLKKNKIRIKQKLPKDYIIEFHVIDQEYEFFLIKKNKKFKKVQLYNIKDIHYMTFSDVKIKELELIIENISFKFYSINSKNIIKENIKLKIKELFYDKLNHLNDFVFLIGNFNIEKKFESFLKPYSLFFCSNNLYNPILGFISKQFKHNLDVKTPIENLEISQASFFFKKLFFELHFNQKKNSN